MTDWTNMVDWTGKEGREVGRDHVNLVLVMIGHSILYLLLDLSLV